MKHNFIIPAEIHSDDHRVRIDFDALPWFENATERQVLKLQDKDWCCSEPADRVAIEHPDPSKQIARVLDYCETISQTGDAMGFEVWVDPEAAARWLKANRQEWDWVSELD